MGTVLIKTSTRGHQTRILHDLLRSGWKIEQIPQNCQIPTNGMKLVLRTDELQIHLRIFAYKVTTSGRSKPHERRVEITTTVKNGLSPEPNYADVVLGVDVDSGKYVGIDRRRLLIGGETHNASSFFDLEGLSVEPGKMLVNPRSVAADVFESGVEYHAFFDLRRISEYLFSHREIHAGAYGASGFFRGKRPIVECQFPVNIDSSKAKGDAFVLYARHKPMSLEKLDINLLCAIERKEFAGGGGRKITPEQLRRLQLACEESGVLGEQAVLIQERRRLKKLGHKDAATNVERVSLRSVSEGYDILSFEDDGKTPRYLEVKSTVGKSMVVDISLGEWKAAKAHREHYYIVRVLNVRDSPALTYFSDPVGLEASGAITKSESGWRLDLQSASSVE